jgi:citrate synthase
MAMSEKKNIECIRSRIWLEEPEADNPFATRAAYCHGYNVYGDMLGHARWVEMLYLLFQGEAPSTKQADMLEALALALANPGPRDAAVHAAMCGGVGGSSAASCLMAALAVGAGHLSGSREVLLAMEAWEACDTELEAWRSYFRQQVPKVASVWPSSEHPPGFDPYGVSTTTLVKQTLSCIAQINSESRSAWLKANLPAMESVVGYPVSLSGVAAVVFTDLGFKPEQGEMLYLLLRLPGAAAHALEQRQYGYKNFPFFSIELENDPMRG